jgi:uncharacterized membrane protein
LVNRQTLLCSLVTYHEFYIYLSDLSDKNDRLAMTEFLAATALFLFAHVVPPAPPVRVRLVAWFGERAYLLGYSLASLALVAWVIAAAHRAPYLPLWDPAPWQALVPVVIMPLATWLLIAGLAEPNPLSVSLRKAGPKSELGPAAAVTRHPVLWAFLLWALSHIVPNGDVVSLTLFSTMALLAFGGLTMVDRRARRRLGETRWLALAATTSTVPFAAILTGRAHVRISMGLMLSLAAALAAYVWFLLQGHAFLIGPDPLTSLRS